MCVGVIVCCKCGFADATDGDEETCWDSRESSSPKNIGRGWEEVLYVQLGLSCKLLTADQLLAIHCFVLNRNNEELSGQPRGSALPLRMKAKVYWRLQEHCRDQHPPFKCGRQRYKTKDKHPKSRNVNQSGGSSSARTEILQVCQMIK